MYNNLYAFFWLIFIDYVLYNVQLYICTKGMDHYNYHKYFYSDLDFVNVISVKDELNEKK